jgi:hypothetical protein
MNIKTILALVAIISVIGLVGATISHSAKASSCQEILENGGKMLKCSSDTSKEHANTDNFNGHFKDIK